MKQYPANAITKFAFLVMKNIIQLKFSLDHVNQEIWRRIQTPSNIKMEQMHKVIQCAMNWNESDIYDFKVGNFPIARNTSLENIIPIIQTSFQYEHSDQKWKVNINIEEKLPINQSFLYSVCLDGAGNFCIEGRENIHSNVSSEDIVKNSSYQYNRSIKMMRLNNKTKFNRNKVNDLLKKLYIAEMNK